MIATWLCAQSLESQHSPIREAATPRVKPNFSAETLRRIVEMNQNGKNGAQPQGDYQRAAELMRKMGSKNGFTPIPPAQHRWQSDLAQPPLHRLWAWMVKHTCDWPAGPNKGCEFAVDREGKELHIEHAAHDLFDDNHGNAWHAWREGIALGLWRNGTKTEGPRRLFLNGELRPVADKSSEEEANGELLYKSIPDYILKQLKQLPPERQKEFGTRYQTRLEIDKRADAALIAGRRLISDREKDNLFREFGLEKRRLDPQKKSAGDTGSESTNGNGDGRGAEIRALVEPFLPELETFVQKVETLYNAEKKTVHKAENGFVLSANGGATLLPAEQQRKATETGAREASAASVHPIEPAKTKTPSREEQKRPRPWERFVSSDAVPEFRTDEEKQARDTLFDQISRMQRAYKHADFSREAIQPGRANDRLAVFRLMKIVRGENALLFCVEVAAKFKGLDRNGLGKLPPRSPNDPHGPRSLGLLLDWAVEFRERRDEMAQAAGGGR
jgi:hypothetical protein